MITSTRASWVIAVMLLAMPAAAQDTMTGEVPAGPETGWTVRWDDHPEVEWSGRLRIEFRARVQGIGHTSGAAVADQDGDVFDVGRKRIGVEGDVGRHVSFTVEREIETANPWRDVWVNYRPSRVAEVQLGQFKVPFGLEETAGSESLVFIYRSLVSRRLTPGRVRGVMLHGRLAGRTIVYEIGGFAHDGENARPNGGGRVFGGRTVAGRVMADPFRRSKAWWSDLRLGVAVTSSSVPEGFPAIRGRSVLGVSFFDSDVWVRGARRRIGVQAQWGPGPVSIASEFIRLADDRRGEGPDGTNLPPFLTRGWYVTGAWLVAGARRVADASDPRQPLFQGGFGSVLLAARFERLRLGGGPEGEQPSTSPRAGVVATNRESALTLGLNWHPNRWIRIDANLIREAIGEAADGPYPTLRFWSRLVRLQVSL